MVLWAREEGVTGNGPKIAFWNNEDILKAESGDEYTSFWANRTLKTAKMVNIISSIFDVDKKK